MTKEEARKIYKEKRNLLSSIELEKLHDLLLIQFQKLQLPFVQYVHTYLPIEEQKEINTEYILQYLEFKNPGLKITIPKINSATQLIENFLYDTATVLKKNNFNIPEPTGSEKIETQYIDLVLVPLIAFDEKGFRVGYGKGYYDKMLAQCKKLTLRIGLSYFSPIQEISDTESFDIPLTHCITPYQIYEFG